MSVFDFSETINIAIFFIVVFLVIRTTRNLKVDKNLQMNLIFPLFIIVILFIFNVFLF